MRFMRIFPIYWIVFTLNLIPYLIKESNYDLLFLLRSFFLIPQDSSPLVIVAWTLTYEVYFYLIFAFFYINKRFAVTFFIFYMIFVLMHNIFGHIFIIGRHTSFHFLFSPFQLLCGLGMLTAYLNKNFSKIISTKALFIFSVGLL